MMRKDDYKNAINEIKASEKLKNETILNITKKKNHKGLAYTIASVMIVAVIGISIAIPVRNNKINQKNDPITIINENGDLPKVENFKNLGKILKNNTNSYGYGKNIVYTDEVMESASFSDSIKAGASTNTEDHSTTNVQVEGVDEADIVKTDGQYIFYIGTEKIEIVNAIEPEKLKLESEIKYDSFNAQEVYITDNKLVVIGNENQYTIAKQYDITDKTNVKLEREVKVQGYYVSSRMINSNIYLIANQYINYWYDLKRDEINEDDYKPKFIDTAISEELKCLDFAEISYIPDSETANYLNIASFDINSREEAKIQSCLGAGDEVYASTENLYIANVRYEYKDSRYYGYYNNYDINTYIYKFKLDGMNIKYVAASSVPGEILNQFSMDENNGFFRIATTDDNGYRTDNNLYVLDENLNLVGSLENLAKGEKIYSIRFMQDRAYMVTFVQTDPLFVIDLKDPKNPTVLGELKIPGYSSYLHPYDDTHIIGFGEDTVVNEYGGVVTNGIKMAMFDVTDPNNPKELFKTKIGTQGTYSELLDNHKALLFSKEKNLMAFPITICRDTSNYRYNVRLQGAMVYNVDLENGFILKGIVTHKDNLEEYRSYDYYKNVERIVYIGNNIFTLSKGLIKAVNLETMDEIGSLEFETNEYYNRPIYQTPIIENIDIID